MSTISRPAAAGVAALLLSSAPLLVPGTATAEPRPGHEGTAAGITAPNKAQIERQEMLNQLAPQDKAPATVQRDRVGVPTDGGTAIWQLALSALLGAGVAGGAIAAAQQKNHRHVVAH